MQTIVRYLMKLKQPSVGCLTHQYLKPYIKPGITTEELDKAEQEYLEIMSTLNERFVANRVEVERLRKEVERVESLQRERLAEEAGQEEVAEESKDIDINNIEEKPEKEIDIDDTEEKGVERNSEAADAVP